MSKSARRPKALLRKRISQTKLHLEKLEARRLLAADWQFSIPLDVNADGFVSPIDALLPINALNTGNVIEGGAGRLPDREQFPDEPFYDTNADCFLTPIDVLLVINALNVDRTGPNLTTQLVVDSAPGGTTNLDRLTNQAELHGIATDPSDILTLEWALNEGEFMPLHFHHDGSFHLDPGLASDGSNDGGHTVTIRAQDALRNASELQFDFTLDTIAPASPASITLDPASDTGSSNDDGITRDDTPTFNIAAELGSTILLISNDTIVGETAGSPATSLTANGLAEGQYIFSTVASDLAGNTSAPTGAVPVAVDTSPPSLVVDSPEVDNVIHRASRLVGSVVEDSIDHVSYSFDNSASKVLAPDASGEFDRQLFTQGIDEGTKTLTVAAVDLAGNETQVSRSVELQRDALRFTITESMPRNGSGEVGVTQRAQIFFSKPVDPNTLTDNNFFASFAGEKIPANIVPANDGSFAWLFFSDPLPSNSLVTVSVVGDSIQSLDGEVLDGDSDTIPGGTHEFQFSTVSTTALPGTSLSGVVMDPGADNLPGTSDDAPLPGVEVFLLGREQDVITTGSDGRFHFDAVPVGNIKVELRGLTATPPAGSYFPEMVMDAFTRPGESNTVMPGSEVIFLPRLNEEILSDVSNSTGAHIVADESAAPELSPEDRARLSVTVPPASLLAKDGRDVDSAQIGISTVPPELVVDMLPPGVLQHTFDITVQALGVTNFSTPAPLTSPNVFGTPPGTQHNFLSFDHTSGRLVIEGTATVSADGTTITTDPGFGVTHPGWHGFTDTGLRIRGGGDDGGGCSPLAIHDTVVDPIPVLRNVDSEEDIELLDHLFVNDDGSFRLTVTNNARPIDDSFFAWRCSELNRRATTMVVELTVKHPEIGAPFTENLHSQLFELLPQQRKTFDVEMLDLEPFLRSIDRDRLYSANVAVKAWRSDTPETLLVDEAFDVVRFLDVADIDHRDGKASLAKTASDGVGGHRRIREIDIRAYASEQFGTGIVYQGANENFSDGSSGDREQIIFDPTTNVAEGLQNAQFDVVSGGSIVGSIEVEADSVKQKVFLDFDSPNTGLLSVLQQIHDGTLGDSSKLTATEKGLIDTAEKRQNVVDAIKMQVEALTDDLTSTIEFTDATATDAVRFNIWDTSRERLAAEPFPGGVLGFASVLDNRDLGPDGQFGTADDKNLLAGLLNRRNKINRGEAGFRLSQALNSVAGGFVDMYIDRYFDFDDYPDQQSFVNAVAKTIVHELGHHLGMYHTGTSRYTNGRAAGVSTASEIVLIDLIEPEIDDFYVGATLHMYSNTANPNAMRTITSSTDGRITVDPPFDNEPNISDGFYIAKGLHIDPETSPVPNPPGPRDLMAQGIDMAGSRRIAITKEAFQVSLGASWTLDDIDDALDYYNSYLSRDFASEWGDVHHSHHAGHGHDGQSHDSGNPGQGVDDDGSDGNTQVGSLFDHPSLQLIELGGSYLDHHDFGTVEVDGDGQVDLLDFAVINVGPEPLNVSEVRLAGELDAYTFTGLENGFSLEPYERQYVQVKFDPLSTGPKPAELTFVSNSGGGDFLISFNGVGQSSGPDLRTSVMNNNLGGVLVNGGEKTVEDFITISNDGLQDLEITGIDIPGPQTDFAFADLRMDISASNPLVLQPEESISLALKFDPSRLGLIPSEIQIGSNSSSAALHQVPIVGTGLGELARQLDFGDDYIAVLGGETLRGKTDRAGNYEFFVPAELDLQVSIFDPVSQLISHQYDRTTASGRGMEIGTPHFTASLEPDNDGDGLPRDIEEALGTSDENRDSNGDGITDYEAVIAGFDPLGPAGRTGLIGSVDLGHPANDILFASSPINGREQLAYIATGDASGGLAVVDVSDETTPFVISKLALPGIAQEIKIDEASQTLGLWNGTQAHLVDVREPASPSLLLTLDDVGRFEFFDGHLFISRDSMLMSLNLQTMEMRDDRALAGQGAIVDMQRVGNLLYAMFGNGRLRIFELAADQSGRITERGEIRVFGTAGKIEVVGDVAYLMTTSGARRPFVTVDVSDPDNLSLLSEENGGIILPRTDFVTAGGPFGFLVGREAVAPFEHLFSVVDVSNPAADTPQITQFVLPEKPRSVSLAEGIAFVAHGTDPSFFQPVGTGGLQIFNFPSTDLNEIPPTITLSTPHDFSTDAGIQLIEGETITFTVDTSDDVGVSHVELLLNGDVIGNDFSPPFEFNTALPILPEGIDAFIQARAFDTGGNASLVDPIEIDIIPDNIAPRVINVEPKDGGFRPEGDIEVLVTLSEALSPNSFTADSFQVFDSSNQVVTPSEIRLQPDEISLLLQSAAAGRYRIRSVLPLEDRAGNPLAPVESSFVVDNGSIHWIGVASDLWEEPGNWSLGRIPGPSDDVVIGVPGDGVVRTSTSTIPSVRSIRSEQSIVSNRGLTLAADSILTGGLTSKFGPASSVITLGGELLLKGKSQIGAKFTGPGSVVNQGIFTFLDNEESELLAPFRNEGHVRVDATNIDIGSSVENHGRWEFRGLANLFNTGGEFVNHKDLRFSSPLTDVSVFAPFQSDGQEIHLPPNRKLELKGGGVISNTTFQIDGNASVELFGENVTLRDVQIAGGGIFETTGGSLTIPENSTTTFNLTEALELGNPQGGQFEFVIDGALEQIGRALWYGAILNIQNEGQFNNRGLMRLENRNRTLRGELSNFGTVEYVDLGTLNLENATIRNFGIWDFQGRNMVVNRPGANLFDNAGVIKATGSEVAQIQVPVTTSGEVDVSDGTLQFTGGGSFENAALIVAEGAKAQFSIGDIIVDGATSFTGAGEVENSAGDVVIQQLATLTLNLPGAGFLNNSSLSQDGLQVFGRVDNLGNFHHTRGTLHVPGVFENDGMFDWTQSGRITGDGLFNTGIVNATDGVNLSLVNATLTNAGEFIFNSLRAIVLFNSVIVNATEGKFSLLGPAGFVPGFGSALHSFVNHGEFTRVGEALSVLIDIAFENQGVLKLLDGETTFADGLVQNGGELILDEATIKLLQQLLEAIRGRISGSGVIDGNVFMDALLEVAGQNAIGELNVTGNYTQGPNGVLSIEIDPGGNDVLNVNTRAGQQTTSLDGTIAVTTLDDPPQLTTPVQFMNYDQTLGNFANFDGTGLPNGNVLVPRQEAMSYFFDPTLPVRLDDKALRTDGASRVSQDEAERLFSDLLARLEASGVPASTLATFTTTEIVVADLEGNVLGLAGAGRIYIDVNAAGAGWFVDETALEDEEFSLVRDHWAAAESSMASGRIDLLTVLAHELTHLAGKVDHDVDGLMAPTIGEGIRHTLDVAIEQLFPED